MHGDCFLLLDNSKRSLLRIESQRSYERNPKNPWRFARRGGTYKYSRIRGYLEGELAEGRLKSGESLPTELDLAEQFGVARSTVRQALAELQRSGLIRRVGGKGLLTIRSCTALAKPHASCNAKP